MLHYFYITIKNPKYKIHTDQAIIQMQTILVTKLLQNLVKSLNNAKVTLYVYSNAANIDSRNNKNKLANCK